MPLGARISHLLLFNALVCPGGCQGRVPKAHHVLCLGLAGQDDLAALASVAGVLGGDLHGAEYVWVGGAPHGEGSVAVRPDGERARGDELGVARAVVRAGVPAFVKLARAGWSEAVHAEADGPASRLVGDDC